MIIGHVHGHMRMAQTERETHRLPYSFLIGSRILAQKVKLIYVHVDCLDRLTCAAC